MSKILMMTMVLGVMAGLVIWLGRGRRGLENPLAGKYRTWRAYRAERRRASEAARRQALLLALGGCFDSGRTRRLALGPPHPNPLPRGEREERGRTRRSAPTGQARGPAATEGDRKRKIGGGS